MKVQAASLDDGLLTIDLVREVPEAMKTRRIEIAGGERKTIEHDRQPEPAKQAQAA